MLRLVFLVCFATSALGLKCWEGEGKGKKVDECETGTQNLNTLLADFGNFRLMSSAVMGGESKCCFNVPESGARGCWNQVLCSAAEKNGKMNKCEKSDNGKELCVCDDKFLCNRHPTLASSAQLLFLAFSVLAAFRLQLLH